MVDCNRAHGDIIAAIMTNMLMGMLVCPNNFLLACCMSMVVIANIEMKTLKAKGKKHAFIPWRRHVHAWGALALQKFLIFFFTI